MRNQNQTKLKNQTGFTLIELLVVVAIIALLSSVALIAFMSARAKGRDAKRISDMVQMNTAMALYLAGNKGYPASVSGSPLDLVAKRVASSLPAAPQPADGGCELINYAAPATGNGSEYYYFASGTSFLAPDGTTTVYPDYGYYFCLGNITGSLPAGLHISTPAGLR